MPSFKLQCGLNYLASILVRTVKSWSEVLYMHAKVYQDGNITYMIFTHEEKIRRAFLRVAFVMHGMWEERGTSDTRLLNPPLIPDEYVLIGRSNKGGEFREHMVPRRVICAHCHEMFRLGKSIEEVAQYIRSRLFIVKISKCERDMLDKSSGLNLRQRMPSDWCPVTGDVRARLLKANIEIEAAPREFHCFTRGVD